MPSVDTRPLSSPSQGVMETIQSEVSAESRPLLEFIVKNARYFVGVIVLLIVALVGTGLYGWIQTGKRNDTLDALARIMARPANAQQMTELEALSKSCPESMRVAVAVATVQSALAQGLSDKVEESYARVAQSEYDTPTGLAAAINQAGVLMDAGKYAEGVKILQQLLPRLTPQTGVQAKMMLAEGAARGKDYELAAKTYEDLAATALIQPIEKDYCSTRARDLRAMARAAADAGTN